MRPGQQNNKRMRGRNRKGPNPLTRSYESNGGDVKIRGTALHIAEKYVQLARDAQASGDRVAAENYLQHAEHYYRILAAAQAQMPQPQPVYRSDEEDDEGEERQERGQFNGNGGHGGERGERQGFQGGPQPAFLAGGEAPAGGEAEEDDEPIGDNRFETRPQPQYNENSERGERSFHGNNNGGGNRQGGGQGQNEGGGNYRGRRRRPYRERFGDRERGGESGQPAVAEAPPGDD
jgi:hypothetical protein